jgi:hypothetical protein
MCDDSPPMYGKWPFPELTTEGKARLAELIKQPLQFEELKSGWWACADNPQLKLELGDWPDDPMFFVWENEKCLGYFDSHPDIWKVPGFPQSATRRWCLFELIVLGALIWLGVWLFKRFAT